jgi:aspartate 1-decarboxylase
MSQAAPLFDNPSNRQQNIDMQVTLLKSKLLRAEVTDRALHYEGSLAIDSALMEQIGLVPYEKILVANIANGERLETYAIEAPKGSHTISLNGAAAHKGKLGDLLVIMSFAQFEQAEAKSWKPKVLVLADGNKRVVRADNVLVGEDVFV